MIIGAKGFRPWRPNSDMGSNQRLALTVASFGRYDVAR